MPIELFTLVNSILEGIDLSEKGFSKESLGLAQAMTFNFHFTSHGKRQLLKKKRDWSKEILFPIYVAIKNYSHSCLLTMINWLYFCAGISLSYNRLLDITRDLANRILHQYERGGVFIPCSIKKNIFTIIVKDNIDQDAKSTPATKHYLCLSVSICSFTRWYDFLSWWTFYNH